MKQTPLRLLVIFLAATGLTTTHLVHAAPRPKERLGLYVDQGGGGMGGTCRYNNMGDTVAKIVVPATMHSNMLNPDGTLKDANKLIANKLIGPTAKISFPVYDVDNYTSHGAGLKPEIDEVYFNGKFIKTLQGFNDTWTDDSFVVDIRELRFAEEGKSDINYNELRIKIDTGNSFTYWCLGVDWASIEFDVAPPYVLAHGIYAGASTWNEKDAPGVLKVLDEKGILYRRFSTPDPNGAVEKNARYLKEQISAFLAPLKSTQVNVIAHSKGGLDTQYLASISRPEFEVLSLTTLNTPYHGSVVADVQMLSREMVAQYVAKPDSPDPGGYVAQYLDLRLTAFFNVVFGAGPQPEGLRGLQTRQSAGANKSGERNNIQHLFTIASDLGAECSRDPTPAEVKEMLPGFPFVDQKTYQALSTGYNLVCNTASVLYTPEEKLIYKKSDHPYMKDEIMFIYESAANNEPVLNDAVSAIRSAHPGWGTPIGTRHDQNHSEIKNRANVEAALEHTMHLR